MGGLVYAQVNGMIDERLVGDDAPRLESTACGDHQLCLGIIDARRQLMGGKAAEDDRMHRP